MAYRLERDYKTIAWDTYQGTKSQCWAEFQTGPEQVPGQSHLANQLISSFIEETQAYGHSVLRVTVYVDTSPTLYTKWQVICQATESPAIPWAAIVVGIVVIIGLFIAWKILKTTENVVHVVGEAVGPAGSVLGLAGAFLLIALGFVLLQRRKPRAASHPPSLPAAV